LGRDVVPAPDFQPVDHPGLQLHGLQAFVHALVLPVRPYGKGCLPGLDESAAAVRRRDFLLNRNSGVHGARSHHTPIFTRWGISRYSAPTGILANDTPAATSSRFAYRCPTVSRIAARIRSLTTIGSSPAVPAFTAA